MRQSTLTGKSYGESCAWRLLRPAPMHRHIDPVAIGILDSMIGILIGFGVDLGVKTRVFQALLDVVEIIDFEAKVADAFLLIFALDFNQCDVDIAIRHVNRPTESALGLEAENFLVELHHLVAIFGHHRDMSYVWTHLFLLPWRIFE